MIGSVEKAFLRFSRKRTTTTATRPLLVELLQCSDVDALESYTNGLFKVAIRREQGERPRIIYEIIPIFATNEILSLRQAVSDISTELVPEEIVPLTFARLVEVLSQMAARKFPLVKDIETAKELAHLAAFEAVGLPTIFALSTDNSVQEFFLDSPDSAIYLDHVKYGRCDTQIYLTERERKALETHMDTFKGYTMDYTNPSLKNEFDIFGNRLRVSLDLEPLAVSGFSLDVRKLTSNSLTLVDLVKMDVLSTEAAAFLLTCLEVGVNITIVGEVGVGKTTVLNALDEALDPRLRRVYIEDAVETKDMLEQGYHQMKLRVDPFDRANEAQRTKSAEIVKILHRSPDIVILGEVQSEEHSKAFFGALAAGIRGLQTFHASSPEQAIQRWQEMHGISKTNLMNLGIIVQMIRPERLASKRYVQSIMCISNQSEREGDVQISLKKLYSSSSDGRLQREIQWDSLDVLPIQPEARKLFFNKLEKHLSKLAPTQEQRVVTI